MKHIETEQVAPKCLYVKNMLCTIPEYIYAAKVTAAVLALRGKVISLFFSCNCLVALHVGPPVGRQLLVSSSLLRFTTTDHHVSKSSLRCSFGTSVLRTRDGCRKQGVVGHPRAPRSRDNCKNSTARPVA